MSQSISAPPSLPSGQGFFARWWTDPERRPTLIGIAGVVVVYILLVPLALRKVPAPVFAHRPAAAKKFNIEIAPDAFTKKKEPPKPKPLPNKFVETNPDAPENIPDNTNNFAAQNQQVAQEKPTPNGKSDMPASQGKKDFESNQIVSGQLSKPVEMVEAVPPEEVTPPKEEQKVVPTKKEENPLKGFEKREGDNPNGFASNTAPKVDNNRLIPNRVEGQKDVPLIQDALAVQPTIDRNKPRPRPALVKQAQVRPAILAERLAGTTNIGPTAVDARWSNYGAYLQRMIESVQIQWERLLAESKVYPASGSTVSVKFVMNAKGEISKIVNVDSTANDGASRACMSAITDRAPYGDWTEDMKAVLGEQQEMTFTFYYQ
jgi:hypothetical protein